LGFTSKVLPEPLADLSAWVVFFTSSPQQGVKYQLLYFDFFCISHEKLATDGKVLSHFGYTSNVLPELLTDLSAWMGFCTSSPQQGVKYQL
jgi:hypothetical protein